MTTLPRNIDLGTVRGFGKEWKRFTQASLPREELEGLFLKYFAIFPWDLIPTDGTGIDVGCGSGRWARFVLERGYKLHLLDASDEALSVARANLRQFRGLSFHHASVADIPLPANSLDFGYSLGVLHHVPDTLAAVRSCARVLKPGAPFLIYLYYRLETRSVLFRLLWKMSNLVRLIVSRLPHRFRAIICDLIAFFIYLPLARCARVLERFGVDTHSIPLSQYRHLSFYSMRTDALDRFGTAMEKRFSSGEIVSMLRAAGFQNITVSPTEPYWCVIGIKGNAA